MTKKSGVGWTPVVKKKRLSELILGVAERAWDGTWRAKIGITNKDENIAIILEMGKPLPVEIARAMFPEFEDLPYDEITDKTYAAVLMRGNEIVLTLHVRELPPVIYIPRKSQDPDDLGVQTDEWRLTSQRINESTGIYQEAMS